VQNFELEPSARVYGLWENENGYTDSLAGTHVGAAFSCSAERLFPDMTAV